ncbi:hypothetical protein M5G27_07335 [Pseudomonas shahriarae]|uniref:Uncharacterized protein n=1 Tax=Pseudomonas shahriarae TaxID=2745512 RepID=A0A9X4HBR5_9PSED|nr:hypothetical protein [Pseudomonas shahriarae]MDD1007293.1 hypothetical protein [Pseudomonas shahriarae]
MKQSPNQAGMEATVQAVLKEFYTNTIVPVAEAEQLDPVELFNASIKSALYLKEQDAIDEHRSSFFTLKS